ncbi:MAG TPA: hypothetical protein VK053_00265 [Jiangellaceae bacterium]|nr:hypothetical protein [Jiangellaceae bacterium]
MAGSDNYKIVPIAERITQQKIDNLRQYLAANVAVHLSDHELAKAARYQEHLELLDLLVEHSRDDENED